MLPSGPRSSYWSVARLERKRRRVRLTLGCLPTVSLRSYFFRVMAASRRRSTPSSSLYRAASGRSFSRPWGRERSVKRLRLGAVGGPEGLASCDVVVVVAVGGGGTARGAGEGEGAPRICSPGMARGMGEGAGR